MTDIRPGIEAEMLNHLRSGSREMRLAAVGVLATLPDARGLEGLSLALADSEREVRWVLATTLAGRESPAFMEAMLQALGTDGPSSLRLVMAAKESVGTRAWRQFKIEKYCLALIRNRATDPALRAAAEALLRAWQDRNLLLRPAGPVGEETLLRPAHGPGDSDSATLLRPSEAPSEPAPPPPRLLQRLFPRRSETPEEEE